MGPGQVELVVRGPGALATSVRLFDWSRADEYETVFAVEAVADGVRARLENVTVTVWDDMSEFFDGLARDFRGWEGERVWINNHLVVTATFGSGGHVYLDWTLRSGFFVRFLEETTQWDNVGVYGIKRKNALPDAPLDYSRYLRLRRQGSNFGGFAYVYAEYSTINLRLNYSQQQRDELGINSARILTTGHREYRVSVDLTDETSLADALQLAEHAYNAT